MTPAMGADMRFTLIQWISREVNTSISRRAPHFSSTDNAFMIKIQSVHFPVMTQGQRYGCVNFYKLETAKTFSLLLLSIVHHFILPFFLLTFWDELLFLRSYQEKLKKKTKKKTNRSNRMS